MTQAQRRKTRSGVEDRWHLRTPGNDTCPLCGKGKRPPSAKHGKHPNIRYRARYVPADGNEIEKGFPTLTAAKHWLSQQSASVTRVDHVAPRKAATTFGAVLDEWFGTKATKASGTQATYRDLINRHVRPKWAGIALDQITHGSVLAWIASLSAGTAPIADADPERPRPAQPLSPATVAHVYKLFLQVLEHALDDGLLPRLPFNKRKVAKALPRAQEPDLQLTVLTAEEVNRVAACADYLATLRKARTLAGRAAEDVTLPDGVVPVSPRSRDGVLIRLCAFTGARPGEALALTVGAIDQKRNTAAITQSLSEVAGQPYKPSATKNRSNRTVPVPKAVVDEISALTKDEARDAYIFHGSTGEPLRLRNWAKRTFAPAVELAGFGGRGITPHDLRHTCATLMISAGYSVKVVQEILGHASAAMTLDVYASFFPTEVKALDVS